MKPTLLTLAALAALGALGGAATVFLGLYDISARSGHWPVVQWALHTTYENAVELRATPEDEVPGDLDTPARAALGAGHFASACAFCHALPGQAQSATALSMNPRPPHVSDLAAHWSPGELHWVIYEGVKMSGMPHWPASREDEVWSVVAYLRAVDAGTAPAHESPEAEPDARAYCAGCHGRDGRSGNPHIPRLDILSADYMAGAMRAYRLGLRDSGYMQHAARMVTPDQIAAVLAHYAGQGVAASDPPAVPAPDPDLEAKGEALARQGTGDVPACTACHGPAATRGSAEIPRLDGQYRPYLAAQLKVWRDGARGGGARSNLMHKAAQDLTDADIAALSAWYAALPPHGDR